MNRDQMLTRIKDSSRVWDCIIVGGGATGLGCAIDAASRGYQTLLVEQRDFAQGTSSRSTKLIHGGVRYLQQGNFSLVLEALKERGLLLRNAPHLVSNLSFIVPAYGWWEGPFYGIGLKLYDALAGKYGFGPSKMLSKKDTLQRIPTVETKGLRGGVIYHDGQFDDARLAINMAETAGEQGATMLNYMQVNSLIKDRDHISGVVAQDLETKADYELRARVVINATGVFADAIRRMDDPQSRAMIKPSQGAHIVLDKSFLPGDCAIMVPRTADGRVLFAIPWHNYVIVGTTDTPIDDTVLEPLPLPREIDFLLAHAARYLAKDPTRDDVLSAFAGLRPLVSSGGEEKTAAISREHAVQVSHSGLVTITGGKWTTYRKMAEDTLSHAVAVAQLEERPSITRELHIHGFHKNPGEFGMFAIYGSDAPALQDLIREDKAYGKPLHPRMTTVAGEVIWAVRHEMARTVEDFLSRRTRALVLDARVSMEMAPQVAELMARELGRNKTWKDHQISAYKKLAQGYL
ncbi:MAG: FAD-dependent oxidoreductase [Deltaproteobacteria bacterium RBG_16_54_11]|nr:MAG: FAD-dependent oxidoreductase [Deltaproteobacteria bacterium RBG_16_54_11]